MFLLATPAFAGDWEQLSGPTVSIQTSQFIAPQTSLLDEITIGYSQELNGLKDEHFIAILVLGPEVTIELYGMEMVCTDLNIDVGVCVSEEWHQISGPHVALPKFVAPQIVQLDEILISYTQMADDLTEDLVSVPLKSHS